MSGQAFRLADLVTKAKEPKTDAAIRLAQLREALAGRFKVVVGEPIDPWALSHLATAAYDAEEAGTKFRSEDWDEALKAEAAAIEKYLAGNGAEPVEDDDEGKDGKEGERVTSKSEQTLDERAEEAVERAWPGDPRNRYAARTVTVKAAHLVQRGLSEPEAVSKVIVQMTPTATAQLAKELRDEGMSADEAQREAARAALSLNKRRLAERAAEAAVQKTIDPAVAAVAAVFKEWRGKANLTQEQLAAEVGVTSRAVQKWEAGTALPQGITAFRVASALNFPLEMVREIGRLQPRTQERD